MPPIKCRRCKGGKLIQADLKNHGTCEYVTHVFGCPDCRGTGVREGDETNRAYAGETYRNERAYSPEW